jgi:(p)ppGpp synthase/HD superfamily hydrolase
MNIAPHPTVKEALVWARELHANQIDKLGKPYTGHIENVVANIEQFFADVTDKQIHEVYLHDAMEDCGVTPNILVEGCYSERVVQVIGLITKPKDKMSNKDYEDWIKQIIASEHIYAIRVTFSDMTDNFNKKRMSLLDAQECNKLNKKYAKPYRMLVEAVNVKVEQS